jgi:6-phosphofructokinase 2
MTRVATLTVSPTIDMSTNIDHLVPELKLRCDEPRYEPGGGGVNVARVLRRFGVDADAVFSAGGMTGDLLQRLLTDEGLRIHPVPIAGSTRENVTVREELTTLQYRFVMPGPTVEPAEWEAIVERLESMEPAPDYLVVSGSLPPGPPEDAYAEIARLARERGSRVILDTSGPALRAAVDAGVFLVKPNLSELAFLEGERWIEDELHLQDAANRLVRDNNCEAAVVSIGAGGALAVTREAMLRIPSPAVPPQSKVGAGDSMVAGIVWGLVQGWPILEAACLGVAAGAAAVMTPGSEMCYREDVERLYAQGLDRIARQATRLDAA